MNIFRHSYLVEILNMGAFLRLSMLFDSYTTIHANVQREEVLPSEKAFAFRMKFDAIRHQGKGTDATLFPEGTKSNSGDIVGQSEGLTRTQVYRYCQ